jgi:hypothetical protein
MKLGWGFLLTSGSKLLQEVSIFALSVLLARYLSKHDYGTYLHVQLITNVTMWAFLLGIPHSVYYFLPRLKLQRTFVLATCAMVTLIGFVVAAGIVVFIEPISQLLSNPDLSQFVLLIALIAALSIPGTLFEPLLLASEQVRIYVICDTLFNLSFFAAIAIPVLMDQPLFRLFEIVACFYAVKLGVMILIIGRWLWRLVPREFGETFQLKKQLQYALPIGLSQNVFEVAKYADKIIVSNFFNPSTYAAYARGAINIPLVNTLSSTLDNLMMPSLVRFHEAGDIKGLMRTWHSSIKLLACFIYPCLAFLLFSAHLLIPALYSDKYLDSVIFFQIYILYLLYNITTYNVIIRVIGKTSVMAWVAILGEGFNVLLTITLIKTLGIVGAPLGIFIAGALMVIGYLLAIAHLLKIRFWDIFPWQTLGKILILAVLPLLPLWWLQDLDYGYWPRLGWMALSYSVGYWILFKCFSPLNHEERHLVQGLLPQRLKWFL